MLQQQIYEVQDFLSLESTHLYHLLSSNDLTCPIIHFFMVPLWSKYFGRISYLWPIVIHFGL